MESPFNLLGFVEEGVMHSQYVETVVTLGIN